MIDFSVTVLPLVVLAVFNFFISWAWYSPLLFAKARMEALGIDLEQKMNEEEKKRCHGCF